MQIIVCKLVVLLFGQNNKAPKPKQCLSATGTNKMLQHAGRIMKLTAVLLLGVCMQIYAAGYGQRITLSERNVPIEKVLKKIQQQTSYKFLYTSQLLQRVPKVTVVVKDATVEDVLDLVLKGQMLDYEVSEGTVVIRAKKEAPAKETTQTYMPDPIEIRGVITDENGAPASGVNVMVKGTSKGTTTNLRGEFVLRDVSENAVLLITSVGYDRQEILVKGKDMINTQLRVAVGNLDEMQVIAYGKTSKRLNTGNVATVKGADIGKQPVNNPLLALQGRVSGLLITQSNGLAGGAVTVRIQGQNSIRYGNDPLYLVDGVPYSSQQLPGIGSILGFGATFDGVTSYGNPFSYINPGDIESVEILKDADATAIYGSRAANGAVLITTKKGKAGKTKVDINLQSGWGKMIRRLDLLNTEEYLQMRKEALDNDGLAVSGTDYDLNGTWDTTRYTDWQDVLLGGTAHYTNIQSSISGGNQFVQYVIGGTYQKESTVFPGDFVDKKESLHFNLNNISSNQKFQFQFSGNYLVDNNNQINKDITSNALLTAPNAPALYNSDGSINWAITSSANATWTNPLSFLYNRYKIKAKNLIGNAVLSYHILPFLEIKGNLGYTSLQTREVVMEPLISSRPENRPFTDRFASYSNGTLESWIVEPQISFKRVIGNGKIEMLVGSTLQQKMANVIAVNGIGYTSDLVLEDINSAASVSKNISIVSSYKYNALFGRLNYNWQDKYVINLSGRRDGSSRFGDKNLFHSFWGLGAAWIFSNEKFSQRNLPFVSFGKFRLNYGTTGNDQIPDYKFLNLYNPPNGVGVSYQGTTSLQPTGLPNPHLQWEETKKFQFGVDIGLFKDRIVLTTNYYHNRSSNQLLPYALPIITGFDAISRNLPAVVENTGWEISFSSTNYQNKNFTWTSNFNFTVPKNKLVEFSNLETSAYANALVIGESINVAKVYNFLGVDPSTGKYQFADGNGGITLRPDTAQTVSRNVYINTSPTFYGGFQNSFKLKGFQLDVFFQFVEQKGPNYYFGHILGGRFNVNLPSYVLQRWRKAGDITTIQKYSSNFSLISNYVNATSSDAWYSSASYIRLKNISLSWQVPEGWRQKAHLQNCRVYIQGQNLLTITNYKGLDPETLNTISLPPLRIITLGLQLTL